MKTSIIYVTGMLSVLDALGVEKRLKRLPAVVRAEANFLSGTSTIEYHENQITLAELYRNSFLNVDITVQGNVFQKTRK